MEGSQVIDVVGKHKYLKLSNKNEREEYLKKKKTFEWPVALQGIEKATAAFELGGRTGLVSGCGSPEAEDRVPGLRAWSTGRSLGDGELIKASEK